jgi:hypothetical protein
MSRLNRCLAITVASLVLAACGGDSPTPSSTADPTVTPGPTAPGGDPSPTATTDPSAPASPGNDGFTCDLPIVEAGSAAIANILDVRVGTHEGYDRLVFEFAQGTPEFTLDRATPPFTQDGSGFPIEVDGDSFLGLLMRGGTKQTDEGTSSYGGPTEFETGFPMLLHAVEGGDFERQSTWYIGLAEEACVRVLLLDGPPRIVIDVER